MEKYRQEIESMMQLHYSSLGERGKRHYAALEAAKLGCGGKGYICSLFGLSYKTLGKGSLELQDSAKFSEFPSDRQRRVGGGRKKFCEMHR